MTFSIHIAIQVKTINPLFNYEGWWFKYEEYYTKWTRGIINSVYHTLKEHPNRKFIWAEISFFKLWYEEQTPQVQSEMKKLVKSGQLEFVTGGWVMHDEAVSTYKNDILQLSLGQAWIKTNFDVTVKYAWLIDPFGHSPTTPIFYSLMNYKGAVINRIHYKEKEARRNAKSLEFHWQLNTNAESKSLFVHALYKGYYDIPNTCGPDEGICTLFDFENPRGEKISPANLPEKARVLAKQYRLKSDAFLHKKLLVPLGDDFKYKTTEFTEDFFNQYDMLINYINEHQSEFHMNIKYASLTDYFNSLNDDIAFPTFKGDFFTYSDRNEEYWSGYYTSRPILKRWIREADNALRIYEIFSAENVRKGIKTDNSALLECQRYLSLVQHHDGVTGTARRAVANDYIEKLRKCITVTEKALSTGMFKSLKIDKPFEVSLSPSRFYSYDVIPEKSTKVIKFDENKHIYFITTESASTRLFSFISDVKDIELTRADGSSCPIQVDPRIIYSHGKVSISPNEWVISFFAKSESLGVTVFVMKSSDVVPESQSSKITYWSSTSEKSIESIPGFQMNYIEDVNMNSGRLNKEFRLENKLLKFETFKGVPKSISYGGVDIKLEASIRVFNSKNSGVYIFESGSSSDVALSSTFLIKIEGPIVSEIHAVYNSALEYQVTRLPKDSKYLDISQYVFIKDKYMDHDFCLMYSTDLKYKDVTLNANGWIPIQRQYQPAVKTESQFYPMVDRISFASIDKDIQLSFMTRSSLAFGLLANDKIAFTLDRQSHTDDGRGLGESFLGSEPFAREFRIYVDSKKENSIETIQDDFDSPASFITAVDESVVKPFSLLEVPEGIRVHSYRPCLIDNDDICIQFEARSKSAALDLKKLPGFSEFKCYVTSLNALTADSSCPATLKLDPYSIQTLIFAKSEKENVSNNAKVAKNEKVVNKEANTVHEGQQEMPQIPTKKEKSKSIPSKIMRKISELELEKRELFNLSTTYIFVIVIIVMVARKTITKYFRQVLVRNNVKQSSD